MSAAVVGVLAVAVNAEWLAGRWARARRQIRIDAELLEKLPPGIGQRLLRARVDEAALTYVVRRDTAIPSDLLTRMWIWTGAGVIGIVATFVGQVAKIAENAWWGPWLGWSGVAVMLVCTFAISRETKALERRAVTEAEKQKLMETYRDGYLRVLHEESRENDPTVEAPILDVTKLAGAKNPSE